jgi:hypothetical protein
MTPVSTLREFPSDLFINFFFCFDTITSLSLFSQRLIWNLGSD